MIPICIATALLLAGLSAGYYFTVWLPAFTERRAADQKADADRDFKLKQGQELLNRKLQCRANEPRLLQDAANGRDISNGDVIEVFYSLFYSMNRNSCLYAHFILYHGRRGEDAGERLAIRDILTNQEIWSEFFKQSRQATEVEAELDRKIQAFW
jgi:hypothetical protein